MSNPIIEALDAAMIPFRRTHASEALARVEETLLINTGRQPLPPLPALQRPSLFYFPGLGTRGWYSASEYPSLESLARLLKEATPMLREEFLTRAHQGELLAYEEQMPGRFPTLDRQDWGSLYLLKEGMRNETNCEACPRSAALMETLYPQFSPSGAFFFSVIGPGTKIPPHHDTMNLKLTCHLPLIVPPDCRIRVDGETRESVEGESLFFDDTFLHEVWNNSDRPRVCLLLDIWHPGLTAIEREAITALGRVMGQFINQGYTPPWSTNGRIFEH
ncbi:aspartyl/asparaginyl beta-hydroxylase domain-containing protein [Myxococcus xanthus]|uniref:aspartyl/asparaginyl beta-hydroxylase domain-containing protein n=1 Tax=Myxococcus xanthus TaxID=34 RepID=UPI0019179897|nr:aspartyl/asparaginyl beta-hydroxylase domain-containing protein [Myxococcus xanthus]QQR41880.1 aspartyl/asparaginyl beta-hydroxylase domain-containing protein [Myxococcus xanthus]